MKKKSKKLRNSELMPTQKQSDVFRTQKDFYTVQSGYIVAKQLSMKFNGILFSLLFFTFVLAIAIARKFVMFLWVNKIHTHKIVVFFSSLLMKLHYYTTFFCV